MNGKSTDSNREMAEKFLRYVRAKNAYEGNSLFAGKRHIKEERKKLPEINKFAESTEVADEFNNASSRETIAHLLFNFGKLCRINSIPYPEKYRKEISELLVEELCTNARSFAFIKAPTEKVLKRCVPVTLYQGSSFCSAIDEEEFQSIRYPYGINAEKKKYTELRSPFHEAAMRRPTNPRAFLREVLKTVKELKGDPRFIKYYDQPHLFVEAAIYCKNNPEKILHDAELDDTGLPYNSAAKSDEELLFERQLLEIMRHTKDLNLEEYPCDVDIEELAHDHN